MQSGSQQAWMNEYLVIPGEVKYFDVGHILKEQGAPKQFINIDNDYRTSIDSLTQFKAYESGSKACKHPSLQDPREVSGL